MRSGMPGGSSDEHVFEDGGPPNAAEDELRRLQDELVLRTSEIQSLRSELAEARAKERDLEDTRRAMLFMLEDLNESAANIERAKKEWEVTFDSIKDLIFIHDKDYRIVRANKSYLDAAGLAESEILGRPYYTVFPKMEGPFRKCVELLQTTREKRQQGQGEEVRTPSGKVYAVRFYPVFEAQEDDVFSVHVLEDITERKKAEQSMKENERRFKRLVESVTDYIYTVTVENGRMAAATHGPGCVSVTGYRPDEYETDPYLWYRMIFQEDRHAVMEQMEHIQQRASVRPLEHRIVHKDGSIRWIKNTPVPRYDERGVLITYDGLISDITERKRLEEELRQAQKMEAIGQLAGGIAHDFNNILSAIIGYGHILRMKIQCDDPLRMNVEHLLKSAERAALLTSSLLAFSRKQVINLADVDLVEIIQRTETFLRRIIGEDVELKTTFKQNVATVYADSGQIEQVLMNLATNARDAMQRGGCLALETDTFKIDDAFIRAHGYGTQGKYALVSVTDTGIGMDKATQNRIFEPFFTTKETGKGTGLGLAMVYGIIKQHQGYINVYSEPGRGTTFRIYLPLIEREREENLSAALPRSQELPRGAETILLAEDDEAIRELSSAVLTEHGYSVVQAINGEDAVSRFAQAGDRVQLLILDMIMPKKNGKEVYEEIRKLRSDVKVIFMSGYTADKIYTEGLRVKGTELLLKPLSPRDLVTKVREVLDA